MPNHEELYFTPDINKPHQKWSVLEDPERPGRRLLLRHYRQPGEKPDVRTSFGFSELSPVLEHYAELNGLNYGRISLGSSAEAFELALEHRPVRPWDRNRGAELVSGDPDRKGQWVLGCSA